MSIYAEYNGYETIIEGDYGSRTVPGKLEGFTESTCYVSLHGYSTVGEYDTYGRKVREIDWLSFRDNIQPYL